ncbi:MAG: hypothetical protein ABSG43_23385 [Solirubrobacteraceae bacterium]|jgi:hypothetical protein
MSYLASHQRRLTLAAAAVATTLLIGVAPGTAGASTACTSGPQSTPFAQFGDEALYSPIPGGSFESGAAGWSLTNAEVASGNESYEVAGGSHSLAIQPEGVAVSPVFCVTPADPTVRFFARQTSGNSASLNVSLRWTDATGASHRAALGSVDGTSSWQPTPILRLATAVPVWPPSQSVAVQLAFKPKQSGGAWAIDDVYMDPQGRG